MKVIIFSEFKLKIQTKMNMQMFALVGYLKKPKTSFGRGIFRKSKMPKKMSKSTNALDDIRDVRFMTELCSQQQDEIENLKKQVQTLKERYNRANRSIYQSNAPKTTKLPRRSIKRLEAVKSINENSFSLLL